MKKMFNAIGNGFRGLFYGVLYESTPDGHKKFSLGRLILVVLLLVSGNIWLTGAELPASMLTVLLTFVGYTLGSKGLAAIEKIIVKK